MPAIITLIMAAAPIEAPVTPAPTKPIIVEGNKRVCEYIESTGSILPKRVCKTKDQWERERAASKALADQRAREQTIYQQTIMRAAKKDQ